MPVLQDGYGQLTLEIDFSSNPVRLWTGDGNLSFGGNTYLPGKLMDIGESQVALSAAQNLPYFSIALTTDGDRTRFLNQDPGPLPAKIQLIWRESETDSTPSETDSTRPKNKWVSAFTIEGRLSDVEFTPSDSLLTVNIEPRIYDVDKGVTEGWNNASQQRRTEGDKGMEYVNKLNQSIRWPP